MALGPIGQIHISVTDLDRSVAFYRDVLQIPLMFVVPGQPMAFFAAGDIRLYLGVPQDERFRSKCVLYFRVPDIDAEFRRLTAAGVAITDRPHVSHRDEDHELWLSAFEDPDGHQLVLMEERPRR
jgi:predicted enzyme related to lactoylglutathione lyase